VIATKIGDVPEIIRNGENGLMIEPNDSDALASSILTFLSDEPLAARCASNALQYAREHFCFDRMMRAKMAVDLALVQQDALGELLSPAPTPELVSSD
jgi:glycosyltransferase involved in cell wall biosynthesis